MVLSLIGPFDHHGVHRVLMVAAFAQTRLKVVPITVGKENETQSYRLNCHPLGGVPALKTEEGYLFGTHAIIRHIARTERPYGANGEERYPSPEHTLPYVLYGKSEQEVAEVDAWLDFVMTEIDEYLFPIVEAEKEPAGQRAAAKHRETKVRKMQESIMEALSALEQRLVDKRQQVKALMSARTANGTARSSQHLSEGRTRPNEEYDEMTPNDEDQYITFTPRGNTALRSYHTYNIKTRMEESPDQKNGESRSGSIAAAAAAAAAAVAEGGRYTEGSASDGSARSSAPLVSLRTLGVLSPWVSTQSAGAASLSLRRNAPPPSDMLFLVGDSLTAADLIVAMALTLAISTRTLGVELKQKFPQVVRYNSAIMRLPTAANVRKALKINLL
ncbi:Glutathione S transferase N terminal domain [Trypanosoma vivax]|uniref:GST N-terminal domain-containing protein n=1 Tax=Trypanosoma vivax (strain Y486) TaxID=1055687 RepID=G0TW98_TRYVY|nr:hypothetical protein TRVL_08968 [Trypanosoma vivax]KAH8604041.1 Glutathione S transferase N terminal domain [Trypanosoma vivax]CCC48236.1 conserved hypothetical protein [Trypanosoma vivax Y486]